MSYQLIKVPYFAPRVVKAVEGFTHGLGSLSANDATTLQVSVVVGQVAGGFIDALLYLEQSKDAGATWVPVPNIVAETITGAGTFSCYMTSSSGILFPNVRVGITVNAIGSSLLLSEVYKTFSQGQNIVPPGAVGGASEATLVNIYNAVDGLETAVASTNTKLDTLHTDIGTTIAGYVDGIETAVGSTNTKLDTLHTDIGSTNTKLDTLHTDIGTTIAGYVDGIETAVASTNTKLDTLHTDIGTTIAGYVDGIEGALATLNGKDFATEATLQKTRKWPYATHAKIVPTSDVNNEYYTYKTSGGVTVGTITKEKATGIITYSPDKVY